MVMVVDFGKRNGIHTFHVTGSRDELNKIVDETRKAGGKFANTPIINHVHRGQYILYLKIQLELVGVGGYGQSNKITSENVGEKDSG